MPEPGRVKDVGFRVAALSGIRLDAARALDARRWWLPGAVTTESGMARHDVAAARTADVVIVRSDVTVDNALLGLLPTVRLVIRAGAGVDNIDRDLLTAKGVDLAVVGGAPAAPSVAEYALWALIGLRRRLFSGAVKGGGRWAKDSSTGAELAGARVAIWGYGNVGAAVGGALSLFGVDVTLLRLPSGRSTSLRQLGREPLASWADAHVLALPLTNSTKGIVDSEIVRVFAQRAPVLVNVGRWDLLDETAVATALREGWISGLAIDPIEPANVDTMSSWSALYPNVVGTPHLGAQTIEAQARVGQRVVSMLDERHRTLIAQRVVAR